MHRMTVVVESESPLTLTEVGPSDETPLEYPTQTWWWHSELERRLGAELVRHWAEFKETLLDPKRAWYRTLVKTAVVTYPGGRLEDLSVAIESIVASWAAEHSFPGAYQGKVATGPRPNTFTYPVRAARSKDRHRLISFMHDQGWLDEIESALVKDDDGAIDPPLALRVPD